MSDDTFRKQIKQLLESNDRAKIAKALARIVYEEQRRRERLEALRRF